VEGGGGVEDVNIHRQSQKEEEKQRQTGRRGEVKKVVPPKYKFSHLFVPCNINTKLVKLNIKISEVIRCINFRELFFCL